MFLKRYLEALLEIDTEQIIRIIFKIFSNRSRWKIYQ